MILEPCNIKKAMQYQERMGDARVVVVVDSKAQPGRRGSRECSDCLHGNLTFKFCYALSFNGSRERYLLPDIRKN